MGAGVYGESKALDLEDGLVVGAGWHPVFTVLPKAKPTQQFGGMFFQCSLLVGFSHQWIRNRKVTITTTHDPYQMIGFGGGHGNKSLWMYRDLLP